MRAYDSPRPPCMRMQYAQSPVNPYAQSSVVPTRQGHLRAMNNVACSFRYGEGVARDNVQALGWFALAAELDHIGGNWNAAVYPRDGRGGAVVGRGRVPMRAGSRYAAGYRALQASMASGSGDLRRLTSDSKKNHVTDGG